MNTQSSNSGINSVRRLLGRRTIIMGIINVTPDSFFDGGAHNTTNAAITHGLSLAADGADILDIGGESSRPGAEPVDPAEEMRRTLPVVNALANAGHYVSIDTSHAQTAREAIALGASMINDITAMRGDPEMVDLVASAGCDYVLMHMQGTPRTMQTSPKYKDVIDDIRAFFEERIAFAISRGIHESAIWLDPGFGFGKTPEHNLEILRRLHEFSSIGLPLLIGTSNKSTIGHVLKTDAHDRLEGTAATVAISIWNGASGMRVHDVRAMARVARMTDAIMGRMYYAF